LVDAEFNTTCFTFETGSHYVQAGLELVILLPSSALQSWDYRGVMLDPSDNVLLLFFLQYWGALPLEYNRYF
jgi:hypothetical protein